MRRLMNQHPGRGSTLALGVLPFILIVAVYLLASSVRLAHNPNDKLLPSVSSMVLASK